MITNIGDMVKYNGYCSDDLLAFEKEFINNNLKIGEFYKILEIVDNWADTGNTWYKIEVGQFHNEYYVPSICFNIDMKKKYGLI